jgi:GT2 family glycosyltransferase
MSSVAESRNTDFAFRFDTRIEPVLFGGELNLSGWLVDFSGQPIHGIRAVIRPKLRRKKIIRARRKRNRPEVAVAYPDLPDAQSSGFLLELRLPFGRNQIELQVLDHNKVWRSFHEATVFAVPIAFLEQIGFTETREQLVLLLRQRFGSQATADRSASTQRSGVAIGETPPIRTKRVDLFATTKSNLFIIEIAELITAGFREAGCAAELHLDAVPDANPAPETMQLVVTPHEFYNLFLTQQVARPRARELTSTLTLLSTEQPETGWFHSNLQWAPFAHAFADINALGVEAYRERGVRCHHLQLGYHPLLAAPQITPHRQRTTDIVFLGSLTDRRDKFFAEHAPFFASRRCHIRLVPLGFAKTKRTQSYLSIARRNELLNDSKILLNVHYSEQKYFEWHRMLVGLANGCCIISETCEGFGPLQPGRHFVMVEPEDLIACCEYYLAHPEECERIAAAALAFLHSELQQAQTCLAFLRECEAVDAAVNAERRGSQVPVQPEIPTDSTAAPLPRELRQILQRKSSSALMKAVKADVRAIGRRLASAVRPSSDSASPELPSQDEIRGGILARRDGYRARLQAQTDTAQRGDDVYTIHDSDAYRRCRQPTLSVVITLYNYAQFVDECLSSVEDAARELHQPAEVVIVNDASTDSSLAAAMRAQSRHDLPVRIVDKQFNTGLADARNTGIRLARAPFVFILDADNLVFPQAFAQLLEAISTNHAPAAFSLLCRFRGTPENRVGLLSYYDWDPEVLVQYPYIDAMAMFRRDALLEHGGYDNELSQIGWFGWEDYDMWLRFAHAGQTIAFVPNVLCLYRHHERSMINTTNLFEVELVDHLVGKYRELVDQFEARDQVFGVERQRVKRFSVGDPATDGGGAKKFLIASGCSIATTMLYRCVHLQEQLQALGHDTEVVEWLDASDVEQSRAAAADVVILYRTAMSAPLRAVIDEAQRAGKPVIFDTDDLVFEPELLKWHRAVHTLTAADQEQHTRGVQGYLETLVACDAATVATTTLADYARRKNSRALLHRNALGSEMLAHAEQCFRRREQRSRTDTLVIGYGSGTATHDIDFLDAAAALRSVMLRFPHVELWLAGPLNLPDTLSEFGQRIRRFPLTDWHDWFALAAQFDIAIAPLERGNVFCDAKSEIKFVEAGAVGVPTIASAVGAYQETITDGVDGFVAANEREWEAKLTLLIEDSEKRNDIASRARATVLERYSPEARTKDLARILPELLAARSTRAGANQ